MSIPIGLLLRSYLLQRLLYLIFFLFAPSCFCNAPPLPSSTPPVLFISRRSSPVLSLCTSPSFFPTVFHIEFSLSGSMALFFDFCVGFLFLFSSMRSCIVMHCVSLLPVFLYPLARSVVRCLLDTASQHNTAHAIQYKALSHTPQTESTQRHYQS